MKQKLLEVIVKNAQEALIAQKAGATRLELVRDLNKGGLTPDFKDIETVSKTVSIPIRVMLRETDDSFVYDQKTFTKMLSDLKVIKQFPIDGIVFGSLTKDNQIDIEQLKKIIAAKGSLKLTFHRAFDQTLNLEKSLKLLIDNKVDTVLTSGGKNKIETNLKVFDNLLKIANSKIEILAGGGINEDNFRQIIHQTNLKAVHIGSAALTYGLFDSSRIRKIVAELEFSQSKDTTKASKYYQDMGDHYVIPAFIDQHTHGGYGIDVMDGGQKYNQYLDKVASEGVGAVMATLITAPMDKFEKVLSEYNLINNDNKAQFLGYHLEGIFLSEKRKGAHKSEYFEKLTFAKAKKLQKIANGNIKLITYAAEMIELADISKIQSLGIKLQLGHSDASGDTALTHFANNVGSVTHMFNAMSPLHHREIGIVGATLITDNVLAEVICDGVHVSPNAIYLLYKLLGFERIIAITDSLNAKGLKDGEYISAGLKVFKKGYELNTERGEIAGGAGTMLENFKNLIEWTGCSIEEAVQMTSTNSAKYFNCDDRYGYIGPGYKTIKITKNFKLIN